MIKFFFYHLFTDENANKISVLTLKYFSWIQRSHVEELDELATYFKPFIFSLREFITGIRLGNPFQIMGRSLNINYFQIPGTIGTKTIRSSSEANITINILLITVITQAIGCNWSAVMSALSYKCSSTHRLPQLWVKN